MPVIHKLKSYHLLVLIFLFIVFNPIYSQNIIIERVDPPFWWAGMKNSKLQLLVKGNNMSNTDVSLNYEGAKISKITYGDNPKYLFVDLELNTSINPGQIPIIFKKGEQTVTYNYEIKKREYADLNHVGFNREDLIYLIMPDRFANGDKTNDIVPGMNETRCNRDSMFYRHGGDLQGIINKLDYLKDLGITALWLNPVLENNQPFASYHGYAITDHYKIDPRLGTNEKYKELVEKCHKSGIKMIKDMVFNHIGNQHWFYKDKPFKDWTHENDTFTYSNFRITTLLDPYASKSDLEKMSFGWFDKHMPDLNYKNPFLARYMIQNAIWWIEYAGLNGFRLDTYAYSDLEFMSELGKAVFNEYPDFNMIGEIWDNGVVIQAFFTKDNCNNRIVNTNLYGITDYQLFHAINNTLNEEQGWNKGVERIYYTLCSDIAYKNPFNNLIFLDNHDQSRVYSVIGENLDKLKIAIGFLLTTRGIPMLYYGTEILMKNFKSTDEKVREDFPGGWADDKTNKFLRDYRNDKENEAFDFIRTLANWRKKNNAVEKGKLMQFVPSEGVYVYFRYSEKDKVMVIINTNKESKTITTERYNEIISTLQKGKNVITGDIININKITINPWGILILELIQ